MAREIENKTSSMFTERPFTARDAFIDDVKTRKAAVPHPRVKSPTRVKGTNGKIISVKMGKKISYKDFCALSQESKKKYIEFFLEYYPCMNVTALAKMFEISAAKLGRDLKKIGVNIKYHTNMEDSLRFERDIINNDSDRDIFKEAKDKARNLNAITYDELLLLSDTEKKNYFNGLFDRYHNLSINWIYKMFENGGNIDISYQTLNRMISKLGVNPGKTSHIIDSATLRRFKNEMMLNVEQKKEEYPEEEIEVVQIPEEDKKEEEVIPQPVVTPAIPKFDRIIKMDIDIEAEDFVEFIKRFNITGPIHVIIDRRNT